MENHKNCALCSKLARLIKPHTEVATFIHQKIKAEPDIEICGACHNWANDFLNYIDLLKQNMGINLDNSPSNSCGVCLKVMKNEEITSPIDQEFLDFLQEFSVTFKKNEACDVCYGNIVENVVNFRQVHRAVHGTRFPPPIEPKSDSNDSVPTGNPDPYNVGSLFDGPSPLPNSSTSASPTGSVTLSSSGANNSPSSADTIEPGDSSSVSSTGSASLSSNPTTPQGLLVANSPSPSATTTDTA